jgi:hypothetical protein
MAFIASVAQDRPDMVVVIHYLGQFQCIRSRGPLLHEEKYAGGYHQQQGQDEQKQSFSV